MRVRQVLAVLPLALFLGQMVVTRHCASQLQALNDTESAVVNGQPVDILDYPYQVALLGEDDYLYCGGVIFSRRVVITAQHCVDRDEGVLYIAAGKSRLSQITQADRYDVQYIIQYPRYIQPWFGKDASVLILSRDLDFSNPRIKSIGLVTSQLAADGLTNAGVTAVVSGWGQTNRRHPIYPDQLQALSMKVISDALSDARMGNLSPDQLPAGVIPGNAGSCFGDSGGPLTVPGPSNTRLLAGLVSWGYDCADGYHPSIFARVSSFASWINRVVFVSSRAPLRDREFEVAALANLRNGQIQVREVVIPRGLVRVTFKLVYVKGPQKSAVLDVSFDRGYNCRQAEICSFTAPMEGLYKLSIRARTGIGLVRVMMRWETLQDDRRITFKASKQSLAPRAKVFFLGFQSIPASFVLAKLTNVQATTQVLKFSHTVGIANFNALAPQTTTERTIQVLGPSSGVVGFAVQNLGSTKVTFDFEIDYSTYGILTPLSAGPRSFGPTRSTATFPLESRLLVGTEVGIKLQLLRGKVTVRAMFNSMAEWSCTIGRLGVSYCGGVVPDYSTQAPVIQIIPRTLSAFSVTVTAVPWTR